MDALSAFGLFAVTAMLVTYAFEQRHPHFTLAFAAACAMGSAYGFLQGAWPFGFVEAIWTLVALRRWFSTPRHGHHSRQWKIGSTQGSPRGLLWGTKSGSRRGG